jgi:multidrug resistance efflux pump
MGVRVPKITGVMAVRVKRERPDQRRHHRVTAPMFVDYGGQHMRAADWSLGGLRLEKFAGTLPEPGHEIELGLMLPFQGFDVSFTAKAEVVRCDVAAAMFAVRFTEIGERERELMQHFIEELVRGSMVDVEDTIQRIDVPVTPASLEPDGPKLTKGTPVKRFPVKTMVMTGVYLVLGVIVFGYAGMLAYTNFYRMEVQTAVITAPVETVTAKADGRVELSHIRPGDQVKAGDVVVKMLDGALDREIELANIEVQERKVKLNFAQKKQIEELDRLRSYATVEMKNLEQTRISVESLAQQYRSAEQNYQRLRELMSKGFSTATKVDEAERMSISLKRDLDVRRVELASRIELAAQTSGKRMFSGNETIGSADIVGSHAELEAEVRLAEHEIQLAQQRYIAQLSQRDRDAVRAPFDGTVLDLPNYDNAFVKKGDVIAIIEQRKDRHINAWLNQDEILKVGIGDEAIVYIPALNESIRGKVTEIDRTTGFVQEQYQRQNPGYAWRGPTDRSAKVKINFSDMKKVEDAERYRSGLPVVVVFEQRSTNSLLSAIKKKIGTFL